MMEFAVIVIMLGIYFWPTFLAQKREHQQLGEVFFLNLLVGWTIIGWVLAFLWAAMGDRKQ